jgi:hypothetical protein
MGVLKLFPTGFSDGVVKKENPLQNRPEFTETDRIFASLSSELSVIIAEPIWSKEQLHQHPF